MSGHSKWAGIKYKKALVDTKKGKEFTKVANMITVAAKQGGGDEKMNFSLRLAIDKARAINMPAANVERAIKRGTGELGGATLEEVTYEGYAPAGVAVLIEAMTDNHNRTTADIRNIFSKHGGNMAEAGAVSYIFEQKSQIEISFKKQKIDKDKIELAIIDSGADDFEQSGDEIIVYCQKQKLRKVKENLESSGINIDSAEITYIPKNEIRINDATTASKVMKLIDILEDNDDVTAVHANLDIPEEILEKI
jgi:YebC/PmpR family DNA-binding regulatory protein